jgi:hypothetical protein
MRLILAALLFVFQIGFSQTEIAIKGTVLSNNFPIANVDVVNVDSKKGTTTDTNGNFSILGKTGNLLVFISKDYELKKIVLNSKFQSFNNLIIQLDLKPEMLKEVLVAKMPSIRISKDRKFEQSKLDDLAMEKYQNTLKNPGVYDGQTPGIDFVKIAGMIGKLFSKEKESVKGQSPPIVFKDLVKINFKPDFFSQTLDLKEEEVGLFLEFCDADPKSKQLENNNNQLALLDFLLQKRDDFKKLETNKQPLPKIP